jgi:membrane-bound ClpP family serine protease
MIYRKLAPVSNPVTTTSEGLRGRIGIVTRETDPERPTYGKVRIGSETWSAESTKVIPEGRKVKVIGSEGVHLVVASLTERKR